MKMACLLFLGLCLFVVLQTTPVQSNGNPQPQRHTSSKEQQPKDGNNISKQATVQTDGNIGTPKTDQGAQNYQDKTDDKTPTDTWIMRATIVIALAAVAQVVAMVRQYFVMRTQSETLQKSIDTLPTIERAYIFVTVEATENDISPTGTVPNSHVHLKISNEGKTPAILKLVQGEVFIGDGYPTKEDVEEATNYVVPGTFIKSGETKVQPIVFVWEGDEWERVSDYKTNFICYGRVKYLDVFNKIRETGFCWEYGSGISHDIFSDTPRTNTFAMTNNKELNYYT